MPRKKEDIYKFKLDYNLMEEVRFFRLCDNKLC